MTVAGAPADLLGLIEGLADLSAATLSYCTGWLSNRSGKRKVLVLIDYGFSTLARLIVAYPRESLRAAWQTSVQTLNVIWSVPPFFHWFISVSNFCYCAPTGRTFQPEILGCFMRYLTWHAAWPSRR
ncbi:MAG: hypothetical protein ACI90C_000813 [Rhodoferax sp.]|jgi:hypothetical protein